MCRPDWNKADPVPSSRSTRAGHYLMGAFRPAPLPPVPPLRLEALQERLSEANMAIARLDGAIQTVPNPDPFVGMYVRKEAVLSNQIEGTQSSLQDLLAAEAAVLGLEKPKDVEEVVNYVAALKLGLARLDDIPVSVRLIREIHERLLQGVRGGTLAPGELRRTQNWIGPMGATLGEASFVPPPPQEVAGALADLETFLHAEDDLPLLVTVGVAHAQFETLHPFLDGNGRVGRLLITLLLCERKVLAKPVLYLSHWFRAHRQEYYERLQAVREDGDWEGWLDFFLIGTTYPAANDLVARLEEMGILREITGGARNRRFRYDRYVRLIEEGVPEGGRG